MTQFTARIACSTQAGHVMVLFDCKQKSNLVIPKCHTLPSATDNLSINTALKSNKCLINT